MTTTATATIHPLRPEDMTRIIAGIPRDLQDVVRQYHLTLAGGCLRALIAGEPVSDFDVFGPSKSVQAAAASLLIHTRRASGAFVTRHDTENAITVLTTGRIPVQFIMRWTPPTAEALIRSFDFTVAQAALTYSKTGHWASICTDAFYPDLAARRLVYTSPDRDEDAAGSLLRVRKFLAKGYTIQADALAAVVARTITRIPALQIAGTEAQVANLIATSIREVDPLQMVDQVEMQADHLVL